MATEIEPMIKLEPNPKSVPVVSYNVPEPTSYTGQNFLELDFIPKGKNASDYFKPEYFKSKSEVENKDLNALKTQSSAVITDKLNTSFRMNIANSVFTNAKLSKGTIKVAEVNGVSKVVSDQPLSTTLSNIKVDDVAQQLSAGYKLNIYKNMYGTLTSNYIPLRAAVIRPRIVLVETYRLSSFLGHYGAGRTLSTFSLLPGEKTKISIKSYKKTESTAKSASSILDSFTEESAEDFEDSVSSENSAKQNSSESFEYHAEAEASASWGWGSAKVSGGVKGGSNSSREEFSKNTQNATSKHANKASAKRDVQINTSSETTEVSGSDTDILREIENVNIGKTLNFVFRQMNQEFITLLHLVDVRLAFFNGESASKTEFTLPELDLLIDEFIVDDSAKRKEVKDMILNQILYIKDYKDNPPVGYDEDHKPTGKPFVQMKYFLDANDKPVNEYYQFSKDQYSKYSDNSGMEIFVAGILVSAQKNVMRTDGVIVDSILGQGDGLDSYSHELHAEEVRAKKLDNDLKEAEIEKLKLANAIIMEGASEQAKLYEVVHQSVASKSAG
ncbi:hypothetical protein L9G16_14060 [Shewanella sp. A25]|nr:hypothetical protein [Shewanella shenzhenensis]